MWTAWTVFGYIMLASRRYFKQYYHLSQALHVFSGTLILIISLIFAIKALYDKGWEIKEVKAHTFFGLFMLACVVLLALMGYCSMFLSIRIAPQNENEEWHRKFAVMHKYLARRILFFGFVTTSTGLAQY